MLGSWLIHDLPSLHRSLRQAAAILDVLSERGFEVSAEKSIFILELRGRKATQALSNVTCVQADGKRKGVRAGRWTLPLKLSHPYLGVILSFRNFELLSYQHRREKAVQTFTRLSTVLRDQRAMQCYGENPTVEGCCTAGPTVWSGGGRSHTGDSA